MNNISIKNNLLIFILLNIFFVIFFLYIKQSVGNDSSVSEWLINYHGGFTRRGLGGELGILLSNLINIPLRKSIFLIQATFHISYLILIFWYLRNLKLNILQLFALYAPIFLLYPIAEIEVLGRKEIILFLFFLTTIFFSGKKYDSKVINSQIFFITPIICLIWEQIVLFFPFFAVVLIIKNNLNTFKQAFLKLSIIFLPSILTFVYIFVTPLSNNGHETMCNFILNEYGEQCYMSANMLVSSTIHFDTLWIHNNAKLEHYIRYILIFLIGFLPLNILVSRNYFIKKNNFITKKFKLNILFFLLYSPSLLLFMYGYDWGRWINITYTFSILLYFYFIRNSIITNNLHIGNFRFNKIIKKKIIIYFMFVLFAFGWNPKTVITGDVASFPGYRIPYKFFKIINN
jgi:hypothetical protein